MRRSVFIVAVATLVLWGCSTERSEEPPSQASVPRVPAALDDSALVADGGVTMELPEGLHLDLVQKNCTVCHSPALIMQQRLSREDWDRTITWMQQNQNLWKLDAAVREAILDYLAEEFGAGAGQGESEEPVYLPNPVW